MSTTFVCVVLSVSCLRHLLRVLDICSLKHESSEEISKFTRVAESLKNDCYNCFSGFSEMFAAGLCSTGQVLFLSVCVCVCVCVCAFFGGEQVKFEELSLQLIVRPECSLGGWVSVPCQLAPDISA